MCSSHRQSFISGLQYTNHHTGNTLKDEGNSSGVERGQTLSPSLSKCVLIGKLTTEDRLWQCSGQSIEGCRRLRNIDSCSCLQNKAEQTKSLCFYRACGCMCCHMPRPFVGPRDWTQPPDLWSTDLRPLTQSGLSFSKFCFQRDSVKWIRLRLKASPETESSLCYQPRFLLESSLPFHLKTNDNKITHIPL